MPSAQNGGSYAELHGQLAGTSGVLRMLLSFAAEKAFDFDVNEPGSRRGARRQAESGAKVSERSEFFAPRLDFDDKRKDTSVWRNAFDFRLSKSLIISKAKQQNESISNANHQNPINAILAPTISYVNTLQ